MPETGFLVYPTDPKLAFTQFPHLTGVASSSTHMLKVDIEELLDFLPLLSTYQLVVSLTSCTDKAIFSLDVPGHLTTMTSSAQSQSSPRPHLTVT